MSTGDMFFDAHNHRSKNRSEILESEPCGCFYCTNLFPPSKIDKWTDYDLDGVGQTALCPYCGTDSVIGSKSGLPITQDFMTALNSRWFRSA